MFVLISDQIKTRVDIVHFLRGDGCPVRANHSDVVLHPPEGLCAVVLGNIHVYHAPFQHHLLPNECIMAPICEYSVHPLTYVKCCPENLKFKLQVPHIINDIDEVKDNIRIRHGDIRSNSLELERYPMSSDTAGIWWEVDSKYITIHTSHFSGYIVTAEEINCCSGSAGVLLFGSLENYPGDDPLVTLKVYMSSIHSVKIKDYEMVRDILQFT